MESMQRDLLFPIENIENREICIKSSGLPLRQRRLVMQTFIKHL
jgi:hypothetical protein